jgi:hypothetical protein
VTDDLMLAASWRDACSKRPLQHHVSLQHVLACAFRHKPASPFPARPAARASLLRGSVCLLPLSPSMLLSLPPLVCGCLQDWTMSFWQLMADRCAPAEYLQNTAAEVLVVSAHPRYWTATPTKRRYHHQHRAHTCNTCAAAAAHPLCSCSACMLYLLQTALQLNTLTHASHRML